MKLAQAKGLVKSTEAQQADILHFQRRTLDALVRVEEDERARLKCALNLQCTLAGRTYTDAGAAGPLVFIACCVWRTPTGGRVLCKGRCSCCSRCLGSYAPASQRTATTSAVFGCRTRKEQAEELTGQLTEEQKEEFAALEEHGSTAEQVRRRLDWR